MRDDNEFTKGLFRSRIGIGLILFGAVAAFLLVTEHRAHLYGWLPYLILLACPLMHFFMHGGHGDHSHQHGRGPLEKSRQEPPGGEHHEHQKPDRGQS